MGNRLNWENVAFKRYPFKIKQTQHFSAQLVKEALEGDAPGAGRKNQRRK